MYPYTIHRIDFFPNTRESLILLGKIHKPMDAHNRFLNIPEQCNEKLCLSNCNLICLQVTTALHPSCTSHNDHIFRKVEKTSAVLAKMVGNFNISYIYSKPTQRQRSCGHLCAMTAQCLRYSRTQSQHSL
jgi:hypothetical protein